MYNIFLHKFVGVGEIWQRDSRLFRILVSFVDISCQDGLKSAQEKEAIESCNWCVPLSSKNVVRSRTEVATRHFYRVRTGLNLKHRST